MKIKGISIWERYVERIVVALAVLVFLAFTAMQFIGNPNAVKAKGGAEIGPADVNQLLADEAERIHVGLAPGSPSPVVVEPSQRLVAQFEQSLREGISPSDRLPRVTPVYAMGTGEDVVRERQAYVEPTVPAPLQVVSNQYFDALLPAVVQVYPELGERFPAPHDVTWATPVAVFSLGEMFAEMSGSDPENGKNPIPESWYASRVSIVDVKIEREELADGNWTNLTTLDPIPGQFSFRSEVVAAEKADATLRNRLLQGLEDPATQGPILQPEFYETSLNSWRPKDPREEVIVATDLSEEELQIQDLKRRLSDSRGEQARLQEKIDELGCDEQPDPGGGAQDPGRPPSGGRAPPGRGGPPGGGIGLGGGRGRRGAGDPARLKQIQTQCKNFNQKLTKVERDIARITDQLNDLDQPVVEEAPQEAPGLMEVDELLIWGHDLDVKFGKTYRYRFTVDIFNPFFARKTALVEDQQDLADEVVLRSEPSDWSPPIDIRRPLRVFITRAAAADDRDWGSAAAEVYRFFQGRWWKGNFPHIEPGQRIGGVQDVADRNAAAKNEIDFGTDWFVLDIIDQASGSASGGAEPVVLLQNLRTGELSEYRSPRKEARHPDLLDLRSEVSLASEPGTG